MIFFDPGVFLFKKDKKMSMQHHWVSGKNDKAHVYKLISGFQGKEN